MNTSIIRLARVGICRDEEGFSLLEMMIAAGVLLVAVMGLMSAYVTAMRLIGSTAEMTLASQAARKKVEEIQETAFNTIFATHNAAPDFAVNGLVAQENDLDGFVGKIVFPVDPANPGFLDESFLDLSLGMPRDLNGDNDMVDQINAGYTLLPLTVRIEWLGVTGNHAFEIKTLLAGG